MNNFAVFIVSHGRPNNVKTYSTLRRLGYTGKIYIIIDDLDKTAEEYKKNYGDEVIVFDKKEASTYTDAGDNFGHLRSVLYARNASFRIAESLGLTYFIKLDDDYGDFRFRFNDQCEYGLKSIKNLDVIFSLLVGYFHDCKKLSCLSISQGGDFIGGDENQHAKNLHTSRKMMNLFVLSPKRRFNFMSRLNDDVSTYLYNTTIGKLFLTTFQICLEQLPTQTNPGGLTDLYLDYGTYVKSFYSVLYHPSGCKVAAMGDRGNWRLHHVVKWNNTAPKILRESVKK